VEALNVILIGSAVVPLTILAFVIWFFFRAARQNDVREATEQRALAERTAPPADRTVDSEVS